MEGSAAEAGSLKHAFMQNPKEISSRPATPAGVRRILRALPSAAGPSLPIADWDRDLAVLAGSGWLAAGCCWTAGICLGGLPVLQVLVQDARGKL